MVLDTSSPFVMENQVGVLEKVVNQQGLKLVEWKTDMNYIKDLLLQMNNKKPSSVDRDNLMNHSEKLIVLRHYMVPKSHI